MNRHLPVLLTALAVAACSNSSSHQAVKAVPAATPKSATCPAPQGFTRDAEHSLALTPATYSPAEDVQAALVYDKLVGGQRTVFTNLKAAGGGDLVVQCNVLDFATADNAHRFALSFQSLRDQAGALVTKLAAPVVPGASLAVTYQEKGQSFRGYGIASTQVIESAALTGTRLVTVSVAGPASQAATAQRLLTQLASA